MSALPSQSRSVASLASLYIVRMLGLFMVLPVLSLAGPVYANSNVFLLGVALGIYGLTQACLQIPFGVLSDRYGRKLLIIIGLIVFAVGSAIAALSQTVEGLILGRALQGAGAIAGVVMAMVGDLTSEENRSKAMASIGASIGVAFALSLVIGPLITDLGGIRWIFWLTFGLSLMGIVIVLFAVPSVPSVKPSLSMSGLKEVLTSVALWRLNIGIFFLHAVLMALFVALPLLLTAVNIPQARHTWVYLGIMFIAFVIMVPLIIVGERCQRVKSLFIGGIALAIVALLMLSLSSGNTLWVLMGALLFFISFNYLEAMLPSLMSKTVASAYRGAGSGLFSTCQFLGAAVGGIMGGWLYSRFGLALTLQACAVLLVCWCLLAFSMVVPTRETLKAKSVVA